MSVSPTLSWQGRFCSNVRETARSWHSISAGPTCECRPRPRRWILIPSCENLSLVISRVCEVALHGDKTFTLRHHKFRVSEALKTGEATALFGTVHNECPAAVIL